MIVTAEQKSRIHHLRAKGFSIAGIARQTGIAAAAVAAALGEVDISRRASAETLQQGSGR